MAGASENNWVFSFGEVTGDANRLCEREVFVAPEVFMDPVRLAAAIWNRLSSDWGGRRIRLFPNLGAEAYEACCMLRERCLEADPDADVRIIGICHSEDANQFALLKKFQDALSGIAGVSPFLVDLLKETLPDKAERIFEIRYPIDPCFLTPSVDLAVKEGDQELSALKLIFVGRMSIQQKRVDRLVELMRDLHAVSVPFEAILVGEGKDAEWMKSELQALMDIGRVRCVGKRSAADICGLLDHADVFVSLSDYEGTPIALLEAMCRGVCPVVSDVSGISALIENGRNGFVVDPNATGSFVEKLSFLARSRASAREMGQRARLLVRERYAPAAVYRFLEDEIAGHCIEPISVGNLAQGSLQTAVMNWLGTLELEAIRADGIMLYGMGDWGFRIAAACRALEIPIHAVFESNPEVLLKHSYCEAMGLFSPDQLPNQVRKYPRAPVVIASVAFASEIRTDILNVLNLASIDIPRVHSIPDQIETFYLNTPLSSFYE